MFDKEIFVYESKGHARAAAELKTTLLWAILFHLCMHFDSFWLSMLLEIVKTLSSRLCWITI